MTSSTSSTSEKTRKSLERAIKRIQVKRTKVVPAGTKLSIAAVAREAALSNSTIHNRYPLVASEIRKLMRIENAPVLVAKRGSVKEISAKLNKARKDIEQLNGDLAKAQSVNLRLMKENELLRSSVAVMSP